MFGSIGVLARARTDVRQRLDDAELDPGLYDAVVRRFVEAAAELVDRTLVLVAVPRPAHRVIFQVADGPFEALLPPTYVDFLATIKAVRDDLAANLFTDAQVEWLTAPLKAVATRLDLVRYGRNNVTYANGIGSYLQLCGYVTDASVTPESLVRETEPRRLDLCSDCDLCVNTCPTGAIGEDRFLVRAHQCLTYANENPGDWPDWIPRRAHNCLIGCLDCQLLCPANPQLQVVDTGISFARDETHALLVGLDDASESVRRSIQDKLQQLGEPCSVSLLGRNLRALVASRRAKGGTT